MSASHVSSVFSLLTIIRHLKRIRMIRRGSSLILRIILILLRRTRREAPSDAVVPNCAAVWDVVPD